MKKQLKVALLSLALLFGVVGCDDIEAKPTSGDLITFSSDKSYPNYFQNNYQKVYDDIVSAGTLNTKALQWIIDQIIADKVDNGNYFVKDAKAESTISNVYDLKKDLIDEKMLSTLNSSSYLKNGKFYESKFLNSIESSLYHINVATDKLHEGVVITPDTTVNDLLGSDYFYFDEVTHELKGTYAKYVEDNLLSDINKSLLTARYICENSFSALGRAYTRKVSYVKLENMDEYPGAAYNLLKAYLTDFIDDETGKTNTNEDGLLDLDKLAKIYKGTYGETTEYDSNGYKTDSGDFHTLTDQITYAVSKIADPVDEDGDPTTSSKDIVDFVMKNDRDIDTSVEDTYTNSGAYSIRVGYYNKLNELETKKISDSDLFTKSGGISDLPSSATDRLFSSSVDSYTVKKNGTTFLTPATYETGSELGQYYFFDSSTNAYYVVVVEDSEFSSSKLRELSVMDETNNNKATKVSEKVAKVALELSSSSTYSSNAVLEALDEAGIATHIHDQTFYDYMVSNYADIFDD
jgi:hypothetical protein